MAAPHARRSHWTGFFVVLILLGIAVFYWTVIRGGKATPDRYNVPAEVKASGDSLTIEYRGKTVFSGRIEAAGGGVTVRSSVFRSGQALTNVVSVTAEAEGVRPVLKGLVSGTAEAFPCEADRREHSPLIVRHVSGLSRSLLNRAVYDRNADWALSVDAGPLAVIQPTADDAFGRTFSLEAAGSTIILRFRPAYYRVHRGLEYFRPWRYKIWQEPVVGWISWFAFWDKVTEQDITGTADVVSEALLPFGYQYLQIDDGYQKEAGLPELWLNPNAKFPHGLAWLAAYIKGKGLRPGLWTGATFKQADYAAAHKDFFVTDAAGDPVRGRWIDYVVDGSNPRALAAVVRPLYRGLRDMGWDYFKVDALRHLRYEGYNTYSDYFERKKTSRVEAYRNYVRAVRKEIGPDHYMLGCWGIRPELIGIIDGCRIGDDGFSYAGLAQYNSWNNVVWRNDPDHIELNEDRYRSLMVTSLTGSALLLTDKPALYRTSAVEPARRAAPVLWTVPGQVFDVDASRSGLLARADAEISGAGPRPFDAGYVPACDLWLLEVSRPFEDWVVLGRTGESAAEIKFADLGLDPDREYTVFEFWSKKRVGSFVKSFIPGPVDPVFRSQCFIIRERTAHPYVLATSRHLSGGGVDLIDVKWSGGTLSGLSRLVAGDDYDIYVDVPVGYGQPHPPHVGGAGVLADMSRDGATMIIKLRSEKGGEAAWSVDFSK